MRTAVLLLCLPLIYDSSARDNRIYAAQMENLPLEEQIKIHQYEEEILQMLLKEEKKSFSKDSFDNITLEDQLKIHQYEQEILQIFLKNNKNSSSQDSTDNFTLDDKIKIYQREQDVRELILKSQNNSSSPSANESTSVSSNGISEQRQPNADFGSEECETSGESLIAVQEALTLDKNASQTMQDPEHIFVDAFIVARHVSESDKQSMRDAFAENKEVIRRNATQLIEENNYRVKSHEVKTKDGYYITLFRIHPKKDIREVSERPVVLLVHGLFGSADDWLLMGPNKSLAYQMTDAGFDVWLGNVRGSKYSQRHTSINPALPEFWEFSIDEIANHDLPAMIDYIIIVTQEATLHYVGHSLGTTAFLAMASAHPEHRMKVAMMYALSPMVYMNHVRSPLFRAISPDSRYYETVHMYLEDGEFDPHEEFMRIIGGKMYETVIGIKEVASNVKCVVSGVDSAGMDKNLMPVIMNYLSTGASVRQIKHYGQAKAAGQLRKYDHGVELNRKVYGQPEPPSYNMTKVYVPVALYFSEEDLLAHPKDVERLHEELPEVTDYYKVPEQHFSHMDFQFSKAAPVTINKRLIDSIKKLN